MCIRDRFCTFDVVKRAAEAGYNMILPHEDTYWNDRDDISIVSSDPLYKTKVDFMREHNIVIFRVHDHMHSQRPDFLYVGLARALGLDSKYLSLIHISEPTRQAEISYAVFCLKKK